MTQREKAEKFRDLHQGPGVLLVPNPWDGGSARVLENLGFQALATSSGACAGTFGRVDGRISRDQALAQIKLIVNSTDLPVSADLENGFADDPADVAGAIGLAAETGLAGASIEDYTRDPNRPLFDIVRASERIAAAASAARALPFPFILTARAENYLRGRPDLDDTIRRLQAYEQAGADVLFAPALPDLAAVREVCRALRKPVNFMVGIHGKSFSIAELAEAGVKRISFASSLYRAAMTGLVTAAREIQSAGTFQYLNTILPTAEWNGLLGDSPRANR